MDDLDPIIRDALQRQKLNSSEPSGDCLHDEQLATYWSGEMGETEKERLYSHVIACEECLTHFVETHAEMMTAEAEAALHEPAPGAIEEARRIIREKVRARPVWGLTDLFRRVRALVRLPSYEPLVPEPLRGESAGVELLDRAETYTFSKRMRNLDLFFNLVEHRGHWSIEAKVEGLSKEANARVVLKRKRKELFSSSLGEATTFFRHVPPARYKVIIKIDKNVKAKLILDLEEKRYGG